jgi:hypothetical protein
MKQFKVTWESGYVSTETMTRADSGDLFIDEDNGEMNEPSNFLVSELELMDNMAVGETIYLGDYKNIKAERIS